MSIELHDAVNGDGLFDVQAKAFAALEALFTAIGTTVPNSVELFLQQFQTRDDAHEFDMAATMEKLPAAIASWQSGASSLSGQIRTNLQNMLLELVAADADQPENTLTYALQYLIDQMIADGDYVAANTVSLTLTAGASNVGDPAICYSHLRGDGLVQQNLIPEVIDVSVASTTGPTLKFRSSVAQANKLAYDWPQGSGINVSLAATPASSSLIANGDFEDATIANTPDNWIIHTGVPGTTVKVTDAEVQTITITGTPTGGSYSLLWTDSDSIVRSAGPFAHDASSAVLQSALRAIPGLEAVTVTSTGTSPNFVHTVTFHNAIGAPAEITSISDLTGGSPSFAHATPTPSSAGTYRGRALEFDSNGSEQTAVYAPVTVDNDTVYFLHLRIKRVGAASSGVVTIDLVDGIGGTVCQDAAGNSITLAINAATMGTSAHDSVFLSFRTAAGTAQPVYLRIRISTAIPNTASVFFDDVVLVKGTRLYAGGPYVAVIAGATKSDSADEWTLTVANNRTALHQDFYNRVFETAAKDLLLPVAGAGDLIPQPWT